MAPHAAARNSTVRHGVLHGSAQHCTAQHGAARRSTAQHGTARLGAEWLGTALHGTALHNTGSFGFFDNVSRWLRPHDFISCWVAAAFTRFNFAMLGYPPLLRYSYRCRLGELLARAHSSPWRAILRRSIARLSGASRHAARQGAAGLVRNFLPSPA
jgi:hypothetical protein